MEVSNWILFGSGIGIGLALGFFVGALATYIYFKIRLKQSMEFLRVLFGPKQ